MNPIRIVILGRPNVGKSTLFNRLYGRRRALVHDEPGVTRDRIEENAEWWVRARKLPVTLIDTGGVGGDRFAEEILEQVRIALSSADAAIFLLDGRSGVTTGDEELLQELNRSGVTQRIPVLAVVNKIDDPKHEEMIGDFFGLGLHPVLTVSAEHGRGMDDLKEAIVDELELDLDAESVIEEPGLNVDLVVDDSDESEEFEESEEEALEEIAETESAATDLEDEGESASAEGEELSDEVSLENDTAVLSDESEEEARETDEEYRKRVGPPRIAVVGRPNVGKSTFINALLNEKRMIVSPIAGTTVDAIDSVVQIGEHEFTFVDTAGIRRKGKTEQGVEVLSVVQTRKALERADVAILMLDGENGVIDQDAKISSLIEEAGCGVILMVNKWDTQRRNEKFTREMAADIVREEMAYLKYAPVLFISAKEGKGFDALGELITEILSQRRVKVPTHEFTEWVREEATIHNPANAKFFLCHQAGRNPPSFVCHVNDPDKIHFSLKRHLLNAIRERWGFMGSPVRLHFIKAERKSLPKRRQGAATAKVARAKKKAAKAEKKRGA